MKEGPRLARAGVFLLVRIDGAGETPAVPGFALDVPDGGCGMVGTMKFCPDCGTAVPEGAKFRPCCGVPVSGETPMVRESAPSTEPHSTQHGQDARATSEHMITDQEVSAEVAKLERLPAVQQLARLQELMRTKSALLQRMMAPAQERAALVRAKNPSVENQIFALLGVK